MTRFTAEVSTLDIYVSSYRLSDLQVVILAPYSVILVYVLTYLLNICKSPSLGSVEGYSNAIIIWGL